MAIVHDFESTRDRIKALKEKYHLTQKELSFRVGVPIRTVEAWEAGERECPSYVFALIEYYIDHTVSFDTGCNRPRSK